MKTSANKRIVITGMGAVSCIGNSVPQIWQSLVAGKSGISRLSRIDTTGWRCQIGGEIKMLDISQHIPVREMNRMEVFCQYAVVAADEALAQAGISDETPIDRRRFGCLVSSGIGGLNATCKQHERMLSSGLERISPLTIPMMIPNMAAGCLAIRYHAKGPNFAVVSACASGLHSIGEATWVIQRGDADIMLAGGTEASLITFGINAFSSMHALSTRNDAPEEASRPFDAGRDGFVPSEGAGILVLEELDHALARGAAPLAEVIGYGASCDAHHITAPDPEGEGCAMAIATALRHAEIPAEEIGYVNAHGTSTPLNDVCETRAIKRGLQKHAYNVPVSSTKSMTGHMLGAAGGFESIVCVEAIRNGIIPPTINLTTPDPECDLDYVPGTARKADISTAMNISLGFGGHNAAIIFRKYEP